MNLKGTKSEENVKAAFAGESQARNKYTFFAEQARKDGNTEVAEMFEKMAKNEMTHAKIWFQLLDNSVGSVAENVQHSAEGENSEWRSMYPGFAKEAREDGFEQLALMFEKVASIERDHERTFLRSLISLQKQEHEDDIKAAESVQPKMQKHGYRCMFCGASFEDRPDVCSVCGAIGSFENAIIN